MARRKNIKTQSEDTFFEVFTESDLPLRIYTISERVGLSPISLLQRWVLQEEYVIGLMQQTGKSTPAQPAEPVEPVPAVRQTTVRQPKQSKQEAPAVHKKKEPKPRKHKNAEYRDELINRVKQLRQDNVTLQKIAEIFNTENMATLSGTGKWFASSIKHLLNAKS